MNQTGVVPPRLREYAADLATGLGKVAARFVEDSIYGIHKASSVNLTDLARALDEPIAIHATQKRLSRNLARPDLRATISTHLLEMAAQRIRSDTPLFVHVYDLRKRFARKMEYLATDEASADAGYRICEIVASEPSTDRFMPVAAHLWSPLHPDYESDREEILTLLQRVTQATSGRGIYFVDTSVTASGVSADDLASLAGLVAIVRLAPLEQPLVPAQQSAILHEIEGWQRRGSGVELTDLLNCDRPYGFTLYKLANDGSEDLVICEVGAIDITCGKQQRSVISWAWDSPRTRDVPKTAVLLMSTQAIKSDRTTLTKVAAAQASVTQVIETNLRQKDRFGLSSFRVLTYHRMQTLLALLQSVVFYEATITRQAKIEKLLATLEPHPGDHPRSFLVPSNSRN